MTTTIELRMNEYPNVSLRKIAAACDVSYQMLLKASKKPVVGEAYDPEAVNYEAVQEYLAKKNILIDLIDWESLNVDPIRKVATLSKDINDFHRGDTVYLRGEEVGYEIIYMTETHVVIIRQDSTEPRCLSHSTFFFKGATHTPRVHNESETE